MFETQPEETQPVDVSIDKSVFGKTRLHHPAAHWQGEKLSEEKRTLIHPLRLLISEFVPVVIT